MKIHELPNGARFLHEGEEYVKTGPMLAAGRNGTRMFPRYLVLQPLDAPDGATKKPETLRRIDVLKAFEAFSAECRDLLDDEGKAALARAQAHFLRALD